MVRFGRHLRAAALFLLLPLAAVSAKDLADYDVGEIADKDLITPIPLDVTDAEATEALQDDASRAAPVVFCFYPLWAGDAEASFHSAYFKTRSSFSNVVQMVFHKRKLAPRELASADFQQVLDAFRKENLHFPVDTNLAALWASAGPDREFVSRISSRLRLVMESPIRSDYVPAGIQVGATVRLLTVTNQVRPTPEMAAERGVDQNDRSLISLSQAKIDLTNRFAPEESEVAQYAATFIKPNCFIDAELTRGLRHSVTESIWAGEHYKAGQIVVARGSAVNKRTKAALVLLKEKIAFEQLRQILANNEKVIAQARRRNLWFAGGFLTALIVSGLLIWRLKRHRKALALSMTSGSVQVISAGADDAWRQRALTAEQRAENANAAIRAGLISHLAHWMSDTVIQKLILQRTRMLDAQQQAASEMETLGEKLETIHNRMQDRLVAYELQIAELEKRLEAKDEMNRELIRAEISSIERKLESERAQSRVKFN